MVILSIESQEFYRRELAEYLSGPGQNWKFRAPERAAAIYVILRAKHRYDRYAAFTITANGDAEFGQDNFARKSLSLAGE